MKSNYDQVYQFKITLRGIKPPIWRRIQVPKTYNFYDLHVAIQDAMEWSDYHLHAFSITNPSTGKKVSIGIPDDDFDWGVIYKAGWKLKIADFFTKENNKASYMYDFGDNWAHTIKLEKILPRDKDIKYPRCVAGKRASPPEDCGGVWGYQEFLEAISNPNHPEHEDMINWIGGEFDPKLFDVKKINFDDPDKRYRNAFE